MNGVRPEICLICRPVPAMLGFSADIAALWRRATGDLSHLAFNVLPGDILVTMMMLYL